MTSDRDGHVRVLPLHVANKIAAGEVVERPASVVKELVENSLDAGARNIAVVITAGGRKLVSVRDDGCGMTRDDAILSLERQATSKILDVDDIERIDTLGFRGEAIPSIASVSRFTLTTRRHDSDEGTTVQVNAGVLADVRAAGCPPGTLVEVRDIFCNVPARRKFLRAYTTEEGHVRDVFTIHALSHPDIGFSLTIDGRELYRLAPAAAALDRIRELFGPETSEAMLPLVPNDGAKVRVTGFMERPGLATPTRRDQYVFVNGRPATSPVIARALRDACPTRAGDCRPAAVIFIELPPDQVDVNVHPTKREVRFRDGSAVRNALLDAIAGALAPASASSSAPAISAPVVTAPATATPIAVLSASHTQHVIASPKFVSASLPNLASIPATSLPEPTPVPMSFPIEPEANAAKPWKWFRFLATTASGYLLIETDSGVVTVNPHAARERIAFEKLIAPDAGLRTSQDLLIPDTVQFSPPDFARVRAALDVIQRMGFRLEEFGRDTFKIDAVPQLIGNLSPAAVLSTIARDLSETPGRRGGERWREELIARAIARSFSGASLALDEKGAVSLVEELAACRMPYVCPRGKPIMIFTSTRELNRKFARS